MFLSPLIHLHLLICSGKVSSVPWSKPHGWALLHLVCKESRKKQINAIEGMLKTDKVWKAHWDNFLFLINTVHSYFTYSDFYCLAPTLLLVLLLLIFEKILLLKNFFVHWTVCFFYIGLNFYSLFILSFIWDEDGGKNSKEWPTVIFLTKQIVLQNRIRENLGYLKIFTFYSIRLWTC